MISKLVKLTEVFVIGPFFQQLSENSVWATWRTAVRVFGICA